MRRTMGSSSEWRCNVGRKGVRNRVAQQPSSEVSVLQLHRYGQRNYLTPGMLGRLEPRATRS